jgi:SPP1 gp7 family putative phage head morphogenesis protein
MDVRSQILLRRRQMKASGKRVPRKLGRPPKQAFPRGIELQYVKALRREAAEVRRIILEEIDQALPTLIATAQRSLPRTDALSDDLGRMTNRMRRRWAERIGNIRSLAAAIPAQISAFNANAFAAQMKTVLGVDVFRHEPWLVDELADWTRANVSLISDIGDKAIGNVDRIVTDSVRRGRLTKELEAKVQAELGIADKRAALIARDQTGKLNGRLTMLRQQDMGIREYIWRGTLDERERPTHVALEGQRRKWSEGIIPGEEVLCRCTAEPVLDEFADLM